MASSFKYIFCIDDNEADLFYNRFLVEQAQIAGTFAEFTELDETIAALEKINQLSALELYPSLILLDLNMPMYNGLELIEKYHLLFDGLKKKGVIPLILTTSQNPHDIKKVHENKIIDALIQKPFKIANIEKYLLPSFEEYLSSLASD